MGDKLLEIRRYRIWAGFDGNAGAYEKVDGKWERRDDADVVEWVRWEDVERLVSQLEAARGSMAKFCEQCEDTGLPMCDGCFLRPYRPTMEG